MNGRPHYHLLLFSDEEEFIPFDQRLDQKLWTSDLVERKWKRGFCPVGNVEWDSIGYVARYALKKRYGNAADAFYGSKKREFATQSKRPAIGRRYFERYWQEMYPLDEVVVNGKKKRPPVRYDQWLKGVDLDLYERVMAKREENQRPDPTMHELSNIALNIKRAQQRWVEQRRKV